jgi:hypothetical protein
MHGIDGTLNMALRELFPCTLDVTAQRVHVVRWRAKLVKLEK